MSKDLDPFLALFATRVVDFMSGPNYEDVICPFCKAEVGEPCRTNFGKVRQAHAVRVDARSAQDIKDYWDEMDKRYEGGNR